MAHIGVDLHQNSFTVCRLAANGAEVLETWQLCAADLERFCLSLDADDEIAVEATGNSAWFRDQVIACVGRVVTVNPRQFRVIRASVKKTDRNDARALAFFLSKDMLPETRAKTAAQSEPASVTHTRDLLVKQRTRLLNKIHALHNRHGIKLKKESLSSKRRLMALDIGRFSTLEQIELRVVRDQALSLSASIAELDREIEQAVATIGNVDDFESADKLAAYLGIVPKVNRSNETDKPGRITKRGNRLVRTTLVQCTLIAIRYSGYLSTFYRRVSTFYRRVKERRGTGKAIIATARKFLAIIYQTLKNRWVFEDFPNFKHQPAPAQAGQPS